MELKVVKCGMILLNMVMASFMTDVMGRTVSFDPSQMALTSGSTPALEILRVVWLTLEMHSLSLHHIILEVQIAIRLSFKPRSVLNTVDFLPHVPSSYAQTNIPITSSMTQATAPSHGVSFSSSYTFAPSSFGLSQNIINALP